jgi:hypothetical protein
MQISLKKRKPGVREIWIERGLGGLRGFDLQSTARQAALVDANFFVATTE